jgi:hypothetical protein
MADARTSEVRGTPVVPFNISLEIMYVCILFFLRDLTLFSARSMYVLHGVERNNDLG